MPASPPAEIGGDLVLQNPPKTEVQLPKDVQYYFAKFATSSALNAKRSFVSDAHGEVRFEIDPSRKVTCRFWIDGRIIDPTVFDGPNGFVSGLSSVCTGRMQRDGDIEFNGSYTIEGPDSTASGEVAEGEDERKFTLRAKLHNGEIVGDLLLDDVFRNAPSITALEDASANGIRFSAYLVDEALTSED